MGERMGRYLAHDEQVVLEIRRHIAALFRSFFISAAVISLCVILGVLGSPEEGSDVVDNVLGGVAIFFAARFGWHLWQWWVDRIVVTDQRIFEVSGVLTRRVASMPLTRVTDMMYRRTILGRLLGYGDLIVESAGQDQALSTIDRLPHPDDFYRTITSLVTQGLPSLLPDEGDGHGAMAHRDQEDTGPLPQIIV